MQHHGQQHDILKEIEYHVLAGDPAVLARRYAYALYELAAEQKQVDTIAGDMKALQGMTRTSADFQKTVNWPRLPRTEMIKAMKALAVSAGLNKLTANFLALLAQNQRLDLLGAIAESYLTEMAEKRGEFTAAVRTAHPLSASQTEQLAARMRDMMGGKVHLDVQQDESLIGGLTIKIGSRLIDASLRTRLEQLERHLKTPSLEQQQKGAA